MGKLFELYEKKEVIIDGMVISPKKTIAKKKKQLYELFVLVLESYSSQVSKSTPVETKLEILREKLILMDRIKELFHQTTKELEKQLKKQSDISEVKKLLQ